MTFMKYLPFKHVRGKVFPDRLNNLMLVLNPVNVDWYNSYGSFIYFELGQFEKSIQLGLRVNMETAWTDFPAYLSAAYYQTGEMEKMEIF